jgi:adenylate cyclase
LAEERVERRLAAILCADVVEYSRLMGADEEKTLAVLKSHRRELIDPLIDQHRGRIFKTTGDGMLIEFASVVDAVRCAVVVQKGMEDRNANLPDSERIRFRIGINVGDVMVDEGDMFGDGVNVAARIEALAAPGEICVSASVREQVGEKLPIGFADFGKHGVKNIARPVRVYRVEKAIEPLAGGADDRNFTADQAVAFLSHWKDPNSPRGPIMIDPETRDIVQNVYIRRVEKQGEVLANIEIATIPMVKDPWKELNPLK